jgi:hypothetical protein
MALRAEWADGEVAQALTAGRTLTDAAAVELARTLNTAVER